METGILFTRAAPAPGHNPDDLAGLPHADFGLEPKDTGFSESEDEDKGGDGAVDTVAMRIVPLAVPDVPDVPAVVERVTHPPEDEDGPVKDGPVKDGSAGFHQHYPGVTIEQFNLWRSAFDKRVLEAAKTMRNVKTAKELRTISYLLRDWDSMNNQERRRVSESANYWYGKYKVRLTVCCSVVRHADDVPDGQIQSESQKTERNQHWNVTNFSNNAEKRLISIR